MENCLLCLSGMGVVLGFRYPNHLAVLRFQDFRLAWKQMTDLLAAEGSGHAMKERV